MTREQVRLAQEELNRLGIRGADGKPLLEDGILGPQTRHALSQRAAQMQAQGIPLPRPKPEFRFEDPTLQADNRALRAPLSTTPNQQMGAIQLPAQGRPPQRDPDAFATMGRDLTAYGTDREWEVFGLRNAPRRPQSDRGRDQQAMRENRAEQWNRGKWQSRWNSTTDPQMAAMGARTPMAERFGDSFGAPVAQMPGLAERAEMARSSLNPTWATRNFGPGSVPSNIVRGVADALGMSWPGGQPGSSPPSSPVPPPMLPPPMVQPETMIAEQPPVIPRRQSFEQEAAALMEQTRRMREESERRRAASRALRERAMMGR